VVFVLLVEALLVVEVVHVPVAELAVLEESVEENSESARVLHKAYLLRVSKYSTIPFSHIIWYLG
jgi:hypothetical protein